MYRILQSSEHCGSTESNKTHFLAINLLTRTD